ncbi:MAG: exosortase system-associated protein, TIGR04073 family [Candidatus Omnitrophota bacterium]
MKKIAVILVVLVSLAVSLHQAEAQTAADKLGRGLANALTGMLALPYTMKEETDNNGIIAGITTGMVKGIGNVIVREIVGVYEILTFPIPVPEGYRPVLDDPEYLL